MLSYRHAFHAGNYADVLKHIVLCKTLEYLIQKPAPILYIDTHAGAGQYSLHSESSKKTAEFESGIGALDFSRLPESISCYQKIVQPILATHCYPGSPQLAAQLLRAQDRLRLFEMHSTDFPLLTQLFSRDRRVITSNSDGYHSLPALLPAKNSRALILIDPSYEIKKDYQLVVEAITQAHKRMSNAHILSWYPIVERSRVRRLMKQLCDTQIRNICQIEFGIEADNRGYGMTGCGMVIINPPWLLADQMRELLPALAGQLLRADGYYSVEQLVDE